MKIIKKIKKSGDYAIQGLIETFKEEFMARVQFSFGFIQFLIGLILKFEFIHLIILFMNMIYLVSLENMNTGVENLTNLVTKGEKKKLAKRAKDSAAASVFIVSVMSWIIFFVFLISDFLNK